MKRTPNHDSGAQPRFRIDPAPIPGQNRGNSSNSSNSSGTGRASAPKLKTKDDTPKHLMKTFNEWPSVENMEARIAAAGQPKTPALQVREFPFADLPSDLMKLLSPALTAAERAALAVSCKQLYALWIQTYPLDRLPMLLRLYLPASGPTPPNLKMAQFLLRQFSQAEHNYLYAPALDERLRNAMLMALRTLFPDNVDAGSPPFVAVNNAIVKLGDHALLAVVDLYEEYLAARKTISTANIEGMHSATTVRQFNSIRPLLLAAPPGLAQSALHALARHCWDDSSNALAPECLKELQKLNEIRPEILSLQMCVLLALFAPNHISFLPDPLNLTPEQKLELASACLVEYEVSARSANTQWQKAKARIARTKESESVPKPVGELVRDRIFKSAHINKLHSLLGLSELEEQDLIGDHLRLLEIDVANLGLESELSKLKKKELNDSSWLNLLDGGLQGAPGKLMKFIDLIALRLNRLIRLILASTGQEQTRSLNHLRDIARQWPENRQRSDLEAWLEKAINSVAPAKAQ